MTEGSIVKKYALVQSLAELAIGSMIHALHIPLSGHLMSLNQSLLLTLALKNTASRKAAVSVTSQISNTVAALKALSPFGARLKPMIGISVQGLLYSLGPVLFGPCLLGAVTGSVLSSPWPFFQPLVLATLIFGTTFFEGLEKLWIETARYFHLSPSLGIQIFGGIVLFKMILAGILGGLTWSSKSQFEERYFNLLEKWIKKATDTARTQNLNATRSSRYQDLQRLLNPWFLFSVILTVSFFIAAKSPSFLDIVLYILRIIATTLIITWSFRSFPISWRQWFSNRLPYLKDIKNEIIHSKPSSH